MFLHGKFFECEHKSIICRFSFCSPVHSHYLAKLRPLRTTHTTRLINHSPHPRKEAPRRNIFRSEKWIYLPLASRLVTLYWSTATELCTHLSVLLMTSANHKPVSSSSQFRRGTFLPCPFHRATCTLPTVDSQNPGQG